MQCNAHRKWTEDHEYNIQTAPRSVFQGASTISVSGHTWNLHLQGVSGLLDAAVDDPTQGDYDGRGQPTASPMLTAIMSGGVGISGRELLSCEEQLAIIYSQLNFLWIV